MKNPIVVIALLASTLAGVQAQVTGNGATTTANQPALPAPTAYGVVEQGVNYRVWQKTTVENGTNRVHRYTELASGLNYQDPSTGQWRPSSAAINLLPSGGAFAAAATQGSHKASFPLDIATGVIQLSGPDGKQLTSRPVALFLEDDQGSALIAVLTNSVGELVGSNQVVYPDAFEGAAASVRYRYTKFGFEQDIVVQGQLPDPAACGLNPARTRLGVLTAFFDTNNPVATPGPVDAADGLSDLTLTFGSMKIGNGRAFSIGNTEASPPPAPVTPASWLNWITNATRQSSFSKATPSYKRWFQLQGRNFLMEEVPYRRVSAQLEQLPPATGRLNTVSTNLFAANSFLDAIPARLLSPLASGAPGQTQAMRLSRVDWDQTRAVVLDYPVTVTSGSGSTFLQGDTTYYVSGPCYLDNLTLYGGAVIKYPNVNSLSSIQMGPNWAYATAFMEVDGALTCFTSPGSSVIFTAADDDTVGETISGSTGNPTGGFYANPAIFSPNSFTLSNVRIRYAQQAVWAGDGGSITLSDSRVTDSGVMAVLGLGDGYGDPMTLTCNNCLYYGPCANGGIVVWDSGNGVDSYNLNNCTIDNIYNLVYGSYGNYYYNYGYAVNSIFANVQGLGYSSWSSYDGWNQNQNGFYNSATFGYPQIIASGNPFQTAGSDNYYLAANYPFRNAGSTDIDPNLLSDLAMLTTYAPQAGSYPDNDGMPDLGYHYPINESYDGDGLPDWWEMEWFGNLGHSSSDLDGNGNTLLQDYTANPQANPNIIQFQSIGVANNYVNTSSVAAQLTVVNYPYYIAILVDDTNLADAVWTAYSSANVTIPLGATQGWHGVWIGLRGYADAVSAAVWQWKRLKLDTTPPQLVITGPTNGAVNVPMIQLTGYCPEPLASISYDLTNALGRVTNQQALITDQTYSTVTWEFTTNYFQCYDVPLTNGLNIITLHARDLAGNTTMTSFCFTVNYAGKPAPVAEVDWPPPGAQVGGDDYTLVGQVDDYTATLAATLTDANGLTYNLNGVVERDGRFWVDHVPWLAGTNVVTLTITDAAGNMPTMSVTNYQSSLGLTLVSPTPGDDYLWDSSNHVYLTVDSDDCTVWMNGVELEWVDEDGYWEGNVPVSPGGVATFNVTAYPAGEDPAGGGDAGNGSGAGYQNPPDPNAVVYEFNLDKPARVYVESDEQNMISSSHTRTTLWAMDSTNPADAYYWDDSTQPGYTEQHWNDAGNDGGSSTNGTVFVQSSGPGYTNLCLEQMAWPADLWPWLLDYGTGIFGGYCGSGPQAIPPALVVPEHCEVSDPVGPTFTFGQMVGFNYSNWQGVESDQSYERHAQTRMKLDTGGRAVPGAGSLLRITGNAQEVLLKRAVPPYYVYNPEYLQAIPPQNLQVGALGNLDTNGELWLLLPAGDPDATVTVVSNGPDYYIFGIGATRYDLAHETFQLALANKNRSRKTVGVGEEVALGFHPVMPTNVTWTATAGGVDTNVTSWTDSAGEPVGNPCTFTAPSNAPPSGTNATITATAGGKSLQIPFTIVPPSGLASAHIGTTEYFPDGEAEVEMFLDPVIIAPTSVSFYRVQIYEVGEAATNITGYFTTNTPPPHDNSAGANRWFTLSEDNEFVDECDTGGPWPSPWSIGGFTWMIPVNWKVEDNGNTNHVTGWQQNISIDGDGTMTLQKYERSETRTIHNSMTEN